MENWTAVEWLMAIAAVIGLIAIYINRDKVKNLIGGGGKGNGDVKHKRK